jgi:hypothetical protein
MGSTDGGQSASATRKCPQCAQQSYLGAKFCTAAGSNEATTSMFPTANVKVRTAEGTLGTATSNTKVVTGTFWL